MSKNTCAIIVAIIAIVYGAVCFLVLPVTYAAVCAAVFVVAQAAVLLCAVFSRPIQGTQGLFLVYPRLVAPVVCMAIQAVSGILAAVFFPSEVAVSIAIGVVLLAISVVSVLTIPKATDYAIEVDQRVADKTEFMRNLQAQLNVARSDMPQDEASEALDALIEKVRFSDPVSNAASAPYEAQIAETLEGDTLNVSCIAEISGLIDKRNSACKAGKQ